MTKPYRACNCRAPATVTVGPDGKRKPGKLLGSKCPDLGKKGHGDWWVRYEAPAGADGKRRQPRLGPFRTEKESNQALVRVLGDLQAGTHVSDRDTRLASYLDQWLSWHTAEIKPSTAQSYAEAFRLYWKPGIGHLRLAELREAEIRAVTAAMRVLNTPAEDTGKSEMVRRLAEARGTWRGQRYRRLPLTEARIRRMTAPLVAALGDCKALPVNPAAGVGGKVRKTKPLLWSAPRVERWRLTGVKPAVVMVWSKDQAETFLDAISAHRLYALFHLATYWGMRRGELVNLQWSDVDLAARRITIRGELDFTTKSEDSDRIIPIDAGTAEVLGAWREQQMFESLEAGEAWQDTGFVFTREDGQPLRPGWVSERFGTLAARAGLPPVRFHDLRHGSASMLIAAGVPAKVVSEILGHATVAFTMDVYAVVADSLLDDAASRIAAFMPGRASTVPAEGQK